MHAMDWLAALTLDKTGKSNAARIRMIPITDNNSIKVNARWDGASPFVTTMVLALVFMEFFSPFGSTGFRFYFFCRLDWPASTTRGAKAESFKRPKRGYVF